MDVCGCSVSQISLQNPTLFPVSPGFQDEADQSGTEQTIPQINTFVFIRLLRDVCNR